MLLNNAPVFKLPKNNFPRSAEVAERFGVIVYNFIDGAKSSVASSIFVNINENIFTESVTIKMESGETFP